MYRLSEGDYKEREYASDKKDLAITDIDKKSVAELLKEGENLFDEYLSVFEEKMSVLEEEMSVIEDATYLPIDNSKAFSYSVNDTEQFDNEGQYSSDIDEEENLDEDTSVSSSDNEIDIAEEPSVEYNSPTKIFHSKTESTEAAVLDTSDSLPGKSSFFGDNLNDDVYTIGGTEVNNLFDQD